MKTGNSKTKAFALSNRGAAALITAASIVFTAVFMLTGCPQSAQREAVAPPAPFVEGGISFYLRPDKKFKTVFIRAVNSGGTPLAVENCAEKTLQNAYEKELHVLDANKPVIIKGDITELQFRSDFPLGSLNVRGIPNLKKLDCRDSTLRSLDVHDLSSLEELELFSNSLTSLNVKGCSALKKLDCGINELTSLDVQGCSELEELSCGVGNLTSLDLHGCSELKKVYCFNNQLTAINIQGCHSLQEFDCAGNRLNAPAFIEILNNLPLRSSDDGAKCFLYGTRAERNHRDFTSPSELRNALLRAKNNRRWKMYRYEDNGAHSDKVEIE